MTIRYFLDTEFIEYGSTIELISIGIVSSDLREYYAINWECDFTKANDWVQENVLTQLPAKPDQTDEFWKTERAIAKDIICFVKQPFFKNDLKGLDYQTLKQIELPGKIQQAWIAATQAIVNHFNISYTDNA